MSAKLLLLDLDGVVALECGPPVVSPREILRLHRSLEPLTRGLGERVVVVTHRSRSEALRILSVICRAEPHPFLKVGDRVRIIGGPLTDMEGILLRRKQEFRVVLSLDFILRSVAVEVSELDVEPISERSSPQRGFRRTR